MAVYLTNDTELKSVADAIREKGSTTDALIFPDGFNEAIANIQTGSTEDLLLARLKNNLISLDYPELTSLASYSLAGAKIKEIYMPKLKKIGSYAFTNADLASMTDFDSSSWTTLNVGCFQYCSINFVKAKTFTNPELYINNYAFQLANFNLSIPGLVLSPYKIAAYAFSSSKGYSKVWISSETIVLGVNTYGCFQNSSVTDIYTDATERPDDWNKNFANISNNNTATVHYGVSKDEFLAL